MKRLAGIAIAVQLTCVSIAGFAQTPRQPLPVEALRILAESIGAIMANSVTPVAPEKLAEYAVQGMLRGLDPYGDFLGKEEFAELKSGGSEAQDGAGIGVEVRLGPGEGGLQVVTPIEGSPAARGGVLPGDFIDRVDGVELKRMTLRAATKLLRGKPESLVSLRVHRPGAANPREISLRREIIRIASVRSMLADRDIGYLRILQFRDRTLEILAGQLAGLQKENGRPLAGLVVDLRSNPGGLFLSSVALAGAFLPEGAMIVRMEARSAGDSRAYAAADKASVKPEQAATGQQLSMQIGSASVVLLIDRGTAAGAEVVAAALKHHKRVTVIGERSSGRGTVQTILPLSVGSAIKLTTAVMIAPGGQPIESVGVDPDESIGQEILSGEFGSEIDKVYLRALEILRPKGRS